MNATTIFIIWTLTAFISSWAMLMGISQCGNRFGWNTKINKEDNRFLMHTFFILFVPGWNLVKSIKFATNPFIYVHG